MIKTGRHQDSQGCRRRDWPREVEIPTQPLAIPSKTQQARWEKPTLLQHRNAKLHGLSSMRLWARLRALIQLKTNVPSVECVDG